MNTTESDKQRVIKFREFLGGPNFHYWGIIDGIFVSPRSIRSPQMQFTGLLDKNGKEIYEGDMIEDNYGHVWDVRFIDGCFWLHREGHGGMNTAFSWPLDCYPIFRINHTMFSKIIGHIYSLPYTTKE